MYQAGHPILQSWKKFIILLLYAGYSLISLPSTAQARVENKAFNITLKMLLSHDVPEINVSDASQKMHQYLFLDARELKEYNISHLQNARFVGYDSFFVGSLKSVEKDKFLIVYCSIGKRSEDITKKVIKAGFTNVHNLYGGIFEWVNQGYPVYDLQNKRTNNVHAYGKFWGKFLVKGRKVFD